MLLLCGLVSAVCAAQPPPAAMVEVRTVQEIHIRQGVLFPATVISRDDSRLSSEVSGRINSIRDVGDMVKQGELLVEIDTTRYRLELAESEAALLPLQSQLEFQRQERQRMEMLASGNHAARNRVEEIQASYQMTKGEIALAEVRIDKARDRLQRSRIHAPFDGVVAERFSSLGEWVEPGNQVLRLVSLANTEIQSHIPTHGIAWLEDRQMLNVVDGEDVVQQRIRTLVPVADPVSRLYELRLETAGQGWLPGHSVQVELPMSSGKQVLAIEHDAIVTRRDMVAVYRVNSENIAEMVPVSTGISNHDHVEIIGDVSVGDRLVIRGNERLRPGLPVIVRE